MVDRLHGKKQYWTPLGSSDSPGTYASVIGDFLKVTFRCLNHHRSGYTIPLTDVQLEAGLAFFDALVAHSDQSLSLLHRFFWTLLIVQPETGEVADWTCPFLSYFAVLALRDDGNFMKPDAFTGILAKMKYLCHVCAIFDADRRKGEHPRGMIGRVTVPFREPIGFADVVPDPPSTPTTAFWPSARTRCSTC
jgi:hypothetical protein